MAKENDELDFIDVLDEDQRNKAFGALGVALVMFISAVGIRGVLLCSIVMVVLAGRKPGNTSFKVFFQHWFKEKLFPQLNEKLVTELKERANSTYSIFGALKDTAQSLFLSSTTGVRAELAWAAFSANMRPAYRDFYFFRTASVNMGAEENPVFAIFVGINDEWYLSPHMRLNFEDVSVLRMMEDR